MKCKQAILAGLLAIFTGNALQAQESARPTTLNLMSYNVHNCIGMDNVRDYDRIARIILQASPDVVALQELDSATQRNNRIYALGELEQRTGMHGIFSAAIPFQGGSYGIGILSKEKPLNYKTVPMPGREEARSMIVAEFSEYIFCATHQSLTPEDQQASIHLILNAIKGGKKPVFLAGDMNSLPSDLPQQMLRKHFITLNDTASYTFPANVPDRCIDYLYAYTGNGFRCQVQQTSVWPEDTASDHRPVVVRIGIVK